jgi:hypothetical protein
MREQFTQYVIQEIKRSNCKAVSRGYCNTLCSICSHKCQMKDNQPPLGGYHGTFKGLFCFWCDSTKLQFRSYNNVVCATIFPLFEDEAIHVDFHLHFSSIAKDRYVTHHQMSLPYALSFVFLSLFCTAKWYCDAQSVECFLLRRSHPTVYVCLVLGLIPETLCKCCTTRLYPQPKPLSFWWLLSGIDLPVLFTSSMPLSCISILNCSAFF